MTTATATTNGHAAASLGGADQLRARLDDPQTAQALNQLLDNAELAAFSLTALDGFLRRGDTIADNVATSIAEAKAALPAESATLGAQLPQLIQLLPQLTTLMTQVTQLTSTPQFAQLLTLLSNPNTLNALAQLLGQIELVAFLVTALDGFLRRSDTIVNNVAASVNEVKGLAGVTELPLAELAQSLPPLVAALPELTQALPTFTAALPQFTAALPQLLQAMPALLDLAQQLQPMLQSDEFAGLMNSGVLNPQTLTIVGEAGNALVETMEASHQPVGLFGLMGALRDPDVQRGLGFLVEFGKRFGGKLR